MKIAIVGLGYVGLPLAIAIAKKFDAVGYDINNTRVSELKNGIDKTKEVEDEILAKSSLKYTDTKEDIQDCNVFIITVPTPIDEFLKPDLTPVISATKDMIHILKKGDIVVYESTVYPGVTDDICVPLLEQSGLKYNEGFYCGYSPERINPGDKEHRVETIKKVVSASHPNAKKILEDIYGSVITAGIHMAENIKVAEMAKVIENTQRDINIAFINELAIICSKLDINTQDVLKAAGTKWNFLNFTPGLVGGHCIGVDPYYLAYKSAQMGYIPEMILAGRKINEYMPTFVINEFIKLMISKKINIATAKIAILGATFKENCPDIRNSKVFELLKELDEFGITNIDLFDPLADSEEVQEEYNVNLCKKLDENGYDGIILAVSHKDILDIDISKYQKSISVVYDIKSVLPNSDKSL
jgi:UDP-N-acetyl-D-galactosamine dehydrogenase